MRQYTDDEKRDAKLWLEAHGLTYDAREYGTRAENGESATLQEVEPERVGPERVYAWDPHVLAQRVADLEDSHGHQASFWPALTAGEREAQDALKEFFDYYRGWLSPAQLAVLEEVELDPELTLQDLATERGVTRQAIHQRQQRALARLVRLVAEDWDIPEGSDLQRFRAQLDEFWLDRFGETYPGLTA